MSLRPRCSFTLSGILPCPCLGDLILNHHEVGAIGVDVIQMEPARENFSHQIRAD